MLCGLVEPDVDGDRRRRRRRREEGFDVDSGFLLGYEVRRSGKMERRCGLLLLWFVFAKREEGLRLEK
jgi:hypothetical protein